MKVIATNKKAYFNYSILDTILAGIELKGSEVKSVRAGSISLAESYVVVKGTELFLRNCYIKPYGAVNNFTPSATRDRKLLLNKSEILKLKQQTAEKGLTLIATKVGLLGSLVKVEVAAARGKKLYDKKEAIKEKDLEREARREIGKR